MGAHGYGAVAAGGKTHLQQLHPMSPSCQRESPTPCPTGEDSTGPPVDNGDSLCDSPTLKTLAGPSPVDDSDPGKLSPAKTPANNFYFQDSNMD